MTTVSADRDLQSIGMVASQLQRPVSVIERTADAIQLHPEMKINNVAYFSTTQVQALTEAISKGAKL